MPWAIDGIRARVKPHLRLLSVIRVTDRQRQQGHARDEYASGVHRRHEHKDYKGGVHRY